MIVLTYMRRLPCAIAVACAAAGIIAPSAPVMASWPSVYALSGSVPPGGTTFVNGSGFKGNETISIYLGATRVQSGVDTAGGTFNWPLTVPATLQPGTYSLEARGSSGDRAWSALTVSGDTPGPEPTATTQPSSTPRTGPSATSTPVAPSGRNLLQNGGFEDGIAPWHAYHALLSLTAQAHGGIAAVRAVPWSPGTGLYYIVDYAGANPWGPLPQGVPASTVGTYTATAWVFGLPGRTIQLCVRHGTTTTIGGTDCASIIASGAWQEIGVTHYVPDTTVNLDVWVGQQHYQSGDAFVLDDVSLTAPPAP